MKKTILICLMGYLCLPISTLKAQSKVVESPPGTDLVYQPGFPGQEGESSSARLGEQAVLIYVELAKKGKLDTLTFETIPFQVSQLHPNFRQKEAFVAGRRGSFFEGINPAEDQLFLFQTVEYSSPGYISIKRRGAPILENYLVFPGDSIKIRINDAAHRITFAGPDSELFTCQYEMSLAAEQARFSWPSHMMTDDPEALLDRDNYRLLHETARNSFGGYMELVSYGEEEKNRIAEQWNLGLEDLPEWKVLKSYRGRISEQAFELLLADLIGNYRAGILNKFRTEMYAMAMRNQDSIFVEELRTLFLDKLQRTDTVMLSDQAKNLSSGWLAYQYEQAYLLAIITNTSFTRGVRESYAAELRAKIYLRFLLDKFQQIPKKTAFIQSITPYMVSADQLGQLEEYRSKYVSGAPVQDFQFEDEQGRLYSKEDFKDKVLVFYFWSTGCGASEIFYKESFERLAAEYQDSDTVQLVAVNASPDAQTWKKGLASGDYSSSNLLNLYMGTEAEEWKNHYNIHLFPQLMMMDGKGKNVEILYLGQSTESIRAQIEAALSAAQESNLSLTN